MNFLTKDWHAINTGINAQLSWLRASLVTQKLKRLPLMRETWVWSLGQEDPLEKEMATHSSILAWRIPWTEKPGGLQSMGSQRVRHNWETNTHIYNNTCLKWFNFESPTQDKSLNFTIYSFRSNTAGKTGFVRLNKKQYSILKTICSIYS